ncbi:MULTISPECIES: methylated-DNA--[protein]-cysteine S-methyltransferase [unclassified Adlercreutzia]|uniref:methylated-DNA--[protein]-cysteine S-methyltransferase n=1 Tax=unclassified Adlercreutzia TaxID=2636013 RepID=UPI0013E9C397|nr:MULTISPECIES: methylated-DNA--[protein]-cysteine S-methyltransferase [unclassified Adlercreutzia]
MAHFAAAPRDKLTYYVYPTPYGPVTIAERAGAVCAVALGDVRLDGERRPAEATNACSTQLLEFFAGKRTSFDVPAVLEGSDFQVKVWRAIEAIPYGQTRTNRDIAEAIGQPEAYRMVGAAVRRNPLAVIVPAHRVVGANGRPTGADRGAQLRAAFLELERRHA